MKKLYSFKFTHKLILFTLLVTLTGCIGDPIFTPQKVKGQPNTFTFPRTPPLDERVLVVIIGGQRKTLWKIIATRDIPARGFAVTAGVVPEGFEQIIPAPPEKFHPVPGTEYDIMIDTNLTIDRINSYLWQGAGWIAE
jgi:hypothetical protein